MSIRIVRLGSPRHRDEGLRIGTVRRPPRGVLKEHYAERDYYDVWLPNLAPSAELLSWAKAEPLTDARFRRYSARYRREMKVPEREHLLATLARLSEHTNFAVGCYCADATRCHRSLLAALLRECGAVFAPEAE